MVVPNLETVLGLRPLVTRIALAGVGGISAMEAGQGLGKGAGVAFHGSKHRCMPSQRRGPVDG